MIHFMNTSKRSKVPIDELVILLPLIITIDAGVDQEEEDEKDEDQDHHGPSKHELFCSLAPRSVKPFGFFHLSVYLQ